MCRVSILFRIFLWVTLMVHQSGRETSVRSRRKSSSVRNTYFWPSKNSITECQPNFYVTWYKCQTFIEHIVHLHEHFHHHTWRTRGQAPGKVFVAQWLAEQRKESHFSQLVRFGSSDIIKFPSTNVNSIFMWENVNVEYLSVNLVCWDAVA